MRGIHRRVYMAGVASSGSTVFPYPLVALQAGRWPSPHRRVDIPNGNLARDAFLLNNSNKAIPVAARLCNSDQPLNAEWIAGGRGGWGDPRRNLRGCALAPRHILTRNRRNARSGFHMENREGPFPPGSQNPAGSISSTFDHMLSFYATD